jgi:hypothetical protein
MHKFMPLLITLTVLLVACGGGGGGSNFSGGSSPDWVVSVDTSSSGEALNTALLGHYGLSGSLYDYDTVSNLATQMQAVGFSEWRVSVGRWEIGSEMLPQLTDSTPCPTDPMLTTALSESALIQNRSWFIDNGSPVQLSDIVDARYNLAYVRDVIDTAVAFGAAPYVSIDLMPLALSANRVTSRTDCTASFTNAVTNHWPANNTIFSQAVVGLVQRIVEGDSNGSARAVTHFEIWNEPEFPYFWHNGLAANPNLFFDMASTTLVALDSYRSASSVPEVQALKFGLASFAAASTAVAAVQSYDTAGVTIPFDFVSFHSYSNDADVILADISDVADAVNNSTRYPDAELVLAEWGSDLAATAGDAAYANSMQPPLLMSKVIAVGAALGLDRAHHAIFYDYHDGVKLGLIANDSSPKPLYRAYELLSDSITAGSVMLRPDNISNNRLANGGAVLVSRDMANVVRALFINPDSSAHVASLEDASGPLTALQTKVFDNYANPVDTQSVTTTQVTIPAQSLVLVRYQ